MARFAKDRGLLRCAAALETAERNLLQSSEYSFRAYHPARASSTADIGVFTAIVDARKLDRADPVPRSTLNITVSNSTRNVNACNTMYEQTKYVNLDCDTVLRQMAPSARQSTNPVLGSILFEISETLSLTVIPAGTGQCVTVVKEVLFDAPLTGGGTSTR
jgi:hypothetical protein